MGWLGHEWRQGLPLNGAGSPEGYTPARAGVQALAARPDKNRLKAIHQRRLALGDHNFEQRASMPSRQDYP